MIDIESAIMQSKNMENVSDGGSACFDFDDEYDYRYEVNDMYNNFVITDLIKRLDKMNINENIICFLSDANQKPNLNQNINSSNK